MSQPHAVSSSHHPPSDPLVSVVVTTYNQANYIREAVESALNQSYRTIEVIVIDDGSTDRTSDVLADFGDRITVIRQENAGVAESRNRGIRAAAGALLAFLDGDDRWHPHKLQRQVDAFHQFPHAGLIVCNGREFDGDHVLADSLFPDVLLKRFHDGIQRISVECVDDMIRENLIYSTSQVMIPRLILDTVGISDQAFRISSDYDLYLRIAFHYPIVFVHEPLSDWRYVATSVSGQSDRRPFRWTEDVLAVLRKQAQLAPYKWQPLIRATLAAKTREIARRAYYYGCDIDAKWARTYLWRLLLRSRRPVVAAYLCGVMTPKTVRSIVAARIGRMLNALASHSCAD